MYIELPNGTKYELPVIPAEIVVSDGGEYARTYTLGLGETVFPGYRKPQRIRFTSFFPYDYDPTYVNIPPSKMLHPIDWADVFTHLLNGTKVNGRPDIIRFQMIEEYANSVWATWIDNTYSVEDFDKEHRVNELTDQWYTLELVQARTASIRLTGEVQPLPSSFVKAVGGPKTEPATDRPPPAQGNVYTVQSGDTLSGIAKTKLGDYGLWRSIYEMNKATIGSNPDLIFPGQQLTLPTGQVTGGGGGGGRRL